MSFLPWSRKPDKGKAPKRDGGKPKDQKGGGKPQGSRSPRGKKGAPPPPQGLTLDQKLDIAGILLVLSGILITLAFLSPTNSAITGPILNLLGQLFGLGRYLAPVGVIALGGWIIARHFGDKLPRIAPERVLGFVLVYVVALVSLHFFFALTPDELYALAEQGQGGGYIGAG
ncbi:MAG: hypothetical protein AAB427_03300, partial [Chloroflexota bacterium]